MKINGDTPLSQLYQTDNDLELRHAWLRKGEQADEHKYVRREWRNGRWVYFYKDDTKRPIGQNYKTATDKSGSASSSSINASDRSSRSSWIRRLIDRGEDYAFHLSAFWHRKAAEFGTVSESSEYPIGQNYKADPSIGKHK